MDRLKEVGISFELCCGEEGVLNTVTMECLVNGTVTENTNSLTCDTLENKDFKNITEIISTHNNQVKCVR